MESNEGAANIWKEAICKAVITSGSAINTSGSAVIPQINNDSLINFITLSKNIDGGKKEFQQILIKYLDMFILQQKEVFNLQKNYGICVFICATVSFIAGLIFSYIQLHNAFKLNYVGTLQSELNINTSGELFIKTSLVGGFVLIISLLFFYLFLKYVYASQPPSIDPYKLLEVLDK